MVPGGAHIRDQEKHVPEVKASPRLLSMSKISKF